MELFFHYLSQPYLLTGIVYTVLITLFGLAGGAVLGIVLAGMQLSRFRALSVAARKPMSGTPVMSFPAVCRSGGQAGRGRQATAHSGRPLHRTAPKGAVQPSSLHL